MLQRVAAAAHCNTLQHTCASWIRRMRRNSRSVGANMRESPNLSPRLESWILFSSKVSAIVIWFSSFSCELTFEKCVAACCLKLQCVAVCCSVLQCGAVCCSVLQCYNHLVLFIYSRVFVMGTVPLPLHRLHSTGLRYISGLTKLLYSM